MVEVPQWTVYEAEAESTLDYENPFWDVDVRCTLTSPTGGRHAVDAYWDGGRTWRMRFCPAEVGQWQWALACSDPTNGGLDEARGTFRCGPYEGDNPLHVHGPVKLSGDRRYLVHDSGEPFFWLGDTAWNGVLRAAEADWTRYLATRRAQRFTAIQFVSTQWRGGTQVLGDALAFAGTERIRVDPAFLQRMDPKVAAINAHGLVAAPVLLWALWESDPGQVLAEADAIRLARYLVARWGAYHVVWFLGGDGRYKEGRSGRWKRIGRAVFEDRRDRLVTMHPCGQSWVGPEFRGEPWFDLIGYQSGHGSSDEHLRWLVEGPPAREWDAEPLLPVINLEPNYEDHPSYHIQRKFDDHEVRRAAYWSLLVSPPAGVSYGHNSIWVWSESPEVPEGHDQIGTVQPWAHGLETRGVHSMTLLRDLFDTLPWWRLRPAPHLLAEQPGEGDPTRTIAAAQTADGAYAVLYTPCGGEIRLHSALLRETTTGRWYNPRSGEWTAAPIGEVILTPDEGDWVLCLEGVRPARVQ